MKFIGVWIRETNMANNLQRLHQAFRKNFIPHSFTQNLLEQTKPLLKEGAVMTSTSGIPTTDILLYGYQRIKSMGIEFSHLKLELHERITQLVNVESIASTPVTISEVKNLNGQVVNPTLMEIYYFEAAMDKPAGYAQDLNGIHKCIESDKSMDLESEPRIALIAMKLAGCNASKIKFMSDEAISMATRHLLENEADKLPEGSLINLIDSAVLQKVNLSEIKLRSKHSLRDVLPMFAEQDIADKFESCCQKQMAMSFVNANSDKIDHDFNPDMYFDF